MDNTNFEKALKGFVKATASSMKYALACSQLALTHFQEHGDLTPAQRFLEAMPKNYVRRAAFLKWLAAHAPVTMENGKLLKDKSDKAIDFNLDGAFAKPFWEFAPDQEEVIFSKADVLAAFMATVKRFRKDKTKPATEADMAIVNQIEAEIKRLAA
jgi:hypothetical protein